MTAVEGSATTGTAGTTASAETAHTTGTSGGPTGERSRWRAVAIPSEHGGWGLTAEPILLGLLVAFSWAGLAIGVAATLAFLVRTPLKLAGVDHRRGRTLPRTVLARRLAAVELASIATLAAVAVALAGPSWLIPVALASPVIAVELWFDIRSRGRRLLPELCGSIGIAAVAAAIIVADGGPTSLLTGVWLLLAGRALAAIPFVRTQIVRLRRGSSPLQAADVFQVIGGLLVLAAALVEPALWPGSAVVGVMIALQVIAMRRSPVPPAKKIGLRQMMFGIAVVVAAAIGWWVA